MKTTKHILLLLSLFLSGQVYSQDLSKQDVSSYKITLDKNSNCSAFSPDGSYFTTAQGKKISFYSAGGLKFKDLSGHKSKVKTINYSDNNKYLVSGGNDKIIKVWDIQAEKVIKTLKGHKIDVLSAKFLNNNRYIASISDDRTLKLWDWNNDSIIYSKEDHKRFIKALAVSPNGKYIATAGKDKRIIIREAMTGNIIKEFTAHKKMIRCLDIDASSKILASGGDDKRVKLWNLETGELIHEFYTSRGWAYSIFNNRERIYDVRFSGDGKFLAAASGDNNCYIYSLKDNTVRMKLEKLPEKPINICFNPNGKEMCVVENDIKTVISFDISYLNISPVYLFKDEKDKTPPQIWISYPPNMQNSVFKTSENIINITGNVLDDNGVRSLLLNNKEVPIDNNGKFLMKFPLTPGDNFVKIEVTDINDNTAVRKFNIIRRDVEDTLTSKKTVNYLFVVGINNYLHWPKLSNAVKDAKDIANILTAIYTFDAANTVILTDSQATYTNIYNTLRSYIEKITPKDNLVIYFSGHGLFDELTNEGYWIPYEAKTKNETEYLSNTSVIKILQNVNSKHTFLIADACFSGTLFAESGRGFTDNVEQYRSRWGLTSGRLEVVSDGARGSNSPFAATLLKFLRENNKDKTAVSELIQYVKMNVPDVAEQTPIGLPLKNVGDEGGEMILYKKSK